MRHHGVPCKIPRSQDGVSIRRLVCLPRDPKTPQWRISLEQLTRLLRRFNHGCRPRYTGAIPEDVSYEKFEGFYQTLVAGFVAPHHSHQKSIAPNMVNSWPGPRPVMQTSQQSRPDYSAVAASLLTACVPIPTHQSITRSLFTPGTQRPLREDNSHQLPGRSASRRGCLRRYHQIRAPASDI